MTAATGGRVGLEDIRRAAKRIAPFAIRTPLLRQYGLADTAHASIYLKPENLQRTGAFKFRGAYNTLTSLIETDNPPHVVTSSSGNHGQAVAAAGRLLNIDVTVVMPIGAVGVKVEGIRGLGADVQFAGTTSIEREEAARQIGRETGAVVIGSFDDARIIAGQGTCGLEIVQDLPDVDVVVVPVGGGGLISGVATAVKSMKPAAQVVGVEPAGASDAYQSLKAGRRITIPTVDTIADGLRTSCVGVLNFAIMSELVDQIVLVEDDEIRAAVKSLAFLSKLTVEPSGAVAVAALLSGKLDVAGRTVAAVISGGNTEPTGYARILSGAGSPVE